MSAESKATTVEKSGGSDSAADESATTGRRINWSRVVAFGVLPALAFLLTLGVAFAKVQDASIRADDVARAESIAAAKDGAVALLSYKPDTVAKALTDARDLTTGDFRASYTQITNEMVIPGAQQKQVSVAATVPATSSVSATRTHAVALVFVDETTIIGGGAPSATTSTVKVTLDKVGDRWLISGFDPV